MSETAVPATPRSANTLAAAPASSARFAARSTRGRGLISTSPILTDNQSVFLPGDIPSSSNASASNRQPATSAHAAVRMMSRGCRAGQPNWCLADCSCAVCPPVLAGLGVPGVADFEDAGDRFAGKGGAVVAVGPDACPEEVQEVRGLAGSVE